MRILVLSNFYPPHFVGGYELGCREVVEGLCARGHELLVVTSIYGRTAKTFPESGILRRFHLCGPQQDPEAVGQHNLREFRSAASNFQPDLIYAWNMEHLGSPLPCEIETHSLPHAYYVSDLWMTRGAKTGRMSFGDAPKPAFWRRVKSTFKRAIFSTSMPSGKHDSVRFQNVQCCSRFVFDKINSLGLANGDCEVIHWGVQVEKFISSSDRQRNPTRLLYLGQLERHKGVHTAVQAFSMIQKEISGATLTIAGTTGESAYLSELRDLAKEAAPSAISFVGKVPNSEVRELYSAHDILLFPSEWDEPFAITPLEAMAAGLAVVATSTGGSKEIFKDGVNCLTFTTRDPNDCARQSVRLMRQPDLLGRVARAGQIDIIENFTLARMLDRIEQHLERVGQGISR